MTNILILVEYSDSMCLFDGRVYDVDSCQHFGSEYVHIIVHTEDEIAALKDVGQLRTMSDGSDTFLWVIVPNDLFDARYEVDEWDDLLADVVKIFEDRV